MEYKTLVSTTPINAEQLNELSREGWVLAEILQWEGKLYTYLKRYVFSK